VTPEAADSLRRSAAHVVVDDVSLPVLGEAETHHVFRVLRVADGDTVSVTDGRGGWRLCTAIGGAVEPTGEVQQEVPPSDPLTIGFAVPKSDRPEWIVQKLTELGVDRIVVLHADRSVVRWDAQRGEKHLAKLRRTALEAVQQCRRVFVPEVDGPYDAIDVLPRAVAAEPGGRKVAQGDDFMVIGPEGGWSERELAVAGDRVSLGPNVLRVETAALVAAVQRYSHPE